MANVNTFMRLLKMFPHPIEAADEHTAVTLTSLQKNKNLQKRVQTEEV